MGNAAFGYVVDLGQALHRRGDPMGPQQFLAVLQEVDRGSAEALPTGERQFLLENTDLIGNDLASEARTAAQISVTRNRVEAEIEVEDGALTTAEVADLLHRAEPNVRRSRLNGDLYATNVGSPGKSLSLPRWQFTSRGRVVPGLRTIIPAFPRHFHPLSIERFMTTERDELDGLSPAAWLSVGGSAEAVARIADELGYE